MEETKIIITYETLFEILRKERDKDELQKLNSTFFVDVASYLEQKRTVDPNSPFAKTDSQKNAIQLVNGRKLVKDLYDRREKKIIEMALIKARMSNALINTSNLLGHEKELFDNLANTLEFSRKSQLANVLSIDYHNRPIFAYSESFTPIVQSQIMPPGPPKPFQEPKELKKDDDISSKESINLEFMHAVPKFMGPNLEVYGPYSQNEHVELPSKIAEILIKKGKAKLI